MLSESELFSGIAAILGSRADTNCGTDGATEGVGETSFSNGVGLVLS